MLKRLGQQLRLGVGRHALSLLLVRRWGQAPARLVAECAIDSQDAASVASGLRQLLGDTWRGWPLCVVLADELARLWQVTPPPNAARLADLEAAAALRFQALYGEGAAQWDVKAGWDAQHPFFAAAVPRTLLGALQQVAAEQHITLVQVQPQFVAAWNRHCRAVPADAWFGLVHEGVLTVGAGSGARLAAARSIAVPAGAGQDWLAGQLAREALRLGVDQPQRLMLCGQLPPAWQRPPADGAALACSVLDAARAAREGHWSPASELAATGSAA